MVTNSEIKQSDNFYEKFASPINRFFRHPETVPCEYLPQKYNYIFRKKSQWELTRMSAIIVCIDFCYAAETAYVTPVLLSLGLEMKYVSMIWCLSPLVGFLTIPILGLMSDKCNSRFGRRRPFIFTLSVGIVTGLIFIPCGSKLGLLFGDKPDVYTKRLGENHTLQNTSNYTHVILLDLLSKNRTMSNYHSSLATFGNYSNLNSTSGVLHIFTDENNSWDSEAKFITAENTHTYGIIITVIGAVLLDFCADVCQSPCTSYLLDITLPEEQASGLAIFSLNAALGSAIGYGIAAIKWDIKLWGNVLERQVIVTFAIITFLYILFTSVSLYSFPEIPMPLLENSSMFVEYQEKMTKGLPEKGVELSILNQNPSSNLSLTENGITSAPKNARDISTSNKLNHGISTDTKSHKRKYTDLIVEDTLSSPKTSLKEYLKSIVFLPKFLRFLCLTNFFYGMGIMSFSVFFTDFVGECVFDGDPRAAKNSHSYDLYKEGVRFGCWGLAFSSICCAIYSAFIEDLVKKCGAKVTFIGGALAYAAGMLLMALTRHKVSVIILSSAAGIMLATIDIMPHMLVAHYHSTLQFQTSSNQKGDHSLRGLGTDIGTVISAYVLSQCVFSSFMGMVVDAVGSNIITAYSGTLFTVCGTLTATQVMYFNI